MPGFLSWKESATRHFSEEELGRLQKETSEALILRLREADTLTIIRTFTELLKHGELERLRKVGNDPVISKNWRLITVAAMSPEMFQVFSLLEFFNR